MTRFMMEQSLRYNIIHAAEIIYNDAAGYKVTYRWFNDLKSKVTAKYTFLNFLFLPVYYGLLLELRTSSFFYIFFRKIVEKF